MRSVHVGTIAKVAYYQLIQPPEIIPGIPLTVLDNVPVATVDPLTPPPTLPPDPPECVARYAQYLKDKYERMSTLPEGDWPPSLGRQYTRLAMIEQKRELPDAKLVATMERDYVHGNIDNIVKRKKAIQPHEIFLSTEDGGQQLKILMDGAPGVGKSTLSRKFCKDWASGELLQQYHLVILLPLRQARIREAISVDDLICVEDPDLKQQIVQHIRKTFGEHVLLIVDGYDELSYEDRTQNSLFLDIVQGDLFPKCSVLVTSRPYASDYLQQLQSVNRHVEILGFTEEQIKHCIIENVRAKPKAVELIQKLKERLDIVSLCYIPLNCAIVLYVYKKEQCTLPQTLTKLYETFILHAVKRHARIIGNDPRIVKLHALEKIPWPFQKQLSVLSHLAYNGLVADKMVFSIDDLEAAFPDCSDVDIEHSLLSLMTVFKEFISTGEDLSYQFLHLTIQEFLAARWAASQLSNDELLKFFQYHLNEERYRMVLLFVAGISQLRFPSAENIFYNQKFIITNKLFDYFLFLAHLIYESQNFSLFRNLASVIQGSVISAAYYSMSPFDCLVLAHFLAWGDCSLKLLDLAECDLTSQSLEIMHRVNLEHHGTTQIEEVDLTSNYPDLITRLSLLPKLPMFKHTRKLTLHGLKCHERVSPNQVELHCLLNMRHLTTLEISGKDYSNKWYFLISLAKFVEALNGMTELQVLRFYGSIDSQNAVGIFRSLEHNTSLEEVDLSENSQLAEGDSEAVGCAIERMLNVNRTLKVLNLRRCGVTDSIVEHILTGLTKNTSLMKLDIGLCKLSVNCAVSLLQQVTTCPTLNRVHVNKVDVIGVGRMELNRRTATVTVTMSDDAGLTSHCVELFRALYYSGLASRLEVNNLTDESAECLVGLAGGSSVKALNLSYNNKIGSTGAVSIFRSLEHNTSLEEVDLSENSRLAVGNSEAVGCAIERMLNVNRTLKVLNLSDCGLNGLVAITHIFGSLEHNTSLEELDLSGNSQLAEGDSEAVGCAIERMLNVNRTLKVLNLSDCGVTDSIVEHILTGMTKNTSLVKLDIGLCKLSVSYAASLLQQVTTCPTLSRVHVGKVNVIGVGRMELDRGTATVTMSHDAGPTSHCVELFRALDHSGLASRLEVNNLTDESAEYLGGLAGGSSIKALNLSSYNNRIGSAGAVSIFRSLQHNTSLEELDLSRNSQLAKGDSEAVGCAIERMLNVNRTLKVLNLSHCGVTDSIVEHIITGMTKNTSLMKLDMKFCKLSVSCAASLLQQVATHPTLSRVHVDVIGIGRVELDRGTATVTMSQGHMIPKNCAEFSRALNHCGVKVKLYAQNLTGISAEYFPAGLVVWSLNLNCKQISSTNAVSILRSLEHNTSLEELDQPENGQLAEDDSEAVGCAIERMLNVNRTLKVLNLSRCGLDTAVVTHIAAGLRHNVSLNELNIGWNHSITSKGWVAVFKALCNNTALKKLDISNNNHLGMEGSLALAEMLSCNKSLTELTIWCCRIPEVGLRQIARGLLQNTSLQTLWVDDLDWFSTQRDLFNTQRKTFLEAEMERLKRNFIPQSLHRLEIKILYYIKTD